MPTRHDRTLERQLATITAGVVREAVGIAGSPDPLAAELVASAVVSMWHAEHPANTEALGALAVGVLGQLADRPEPDVLALLLAMSVMAPTPLDELARVSIAHLRAQSVPEPLWVRSVGKPRLVDAWISTDELDDQSNVLAAFAYGSRPPHAFNLIIDVNFQGLIRDAFAADEADRVRDKWVRVSGLPVRALTRQALADILGQAIEMYDIYLEPPVSDGARHLMPLLRSRLHLLPKPRRIETPEVGEDERAALVAEFAASPEAAGLGRLDDRPAAEIAGWLVDFACDYGAGDPLRWSPIAVEIMLVDWLPRKVNLDTEEVDVMPDVLRRWVRFSARRKGLSDTVIAETLEAIDTFAPEFGAGMADTDRAGPAKQLYMELVADGIDISDEEAVQRWIDARNARLSGRSLPSICSRRSSARRSRPSKRGGRRRR